MTVHKEIPPLARCIQLLFGKRTATNIGDVRETSATTDLLNVTIVRQLAATLSDVTETSSAIGSLNTVR